MLSDRPRQPPIASAKCWLSTRRTSRWWRTTRSWPAMWVWNMTPFKWRLLCGFCAHMFSVKCLFFLLFSFILVFFRQSSCWNGSVAPSPGCRTVSGRRLWVKCRPSRRTSETTAVSTSHPRFEFKTVLFVYYWSAIWIHYVNNGLVVLLGPREMSAGDQLQHPAN